MVSLNGSTGWGSRSRSTRMSGRGWSPDKGFILHLRKSPDGHFQLQIRRTQTTDNSLGERWNVRWTKTSTSLWRIFLIKPTTRSLKPSICWQRKNSYTVNSCNSNFFLFIYVENKDVIWLSDHSVTYPLFGIFTKPNCLDQVPILREKGVDRT